MVNCDTFQQNRRILQQYLTEKDYIYGDETKHGILTLYSSLGLNRLVYHDVRHEHVNHFEIPMAKGSIDQDDHMRNIQRVSGLLVDNGFEGLLKAYMENEETPFNLMALNTDSIPLVADLSKKGAKKKDSVLSQIYRNHQEMLIDPRTEPSVLDFPNNEALFKLYGQVPTYFVPFIKKGRVYAIIGMNRFFEENKGLEDIVEPIEKEKFSVASFLVMSHMGEVIGRKKAYEAAQITRTDFAEKLAHELRNPIMSLAGHLNGVKKAIAVDDLDKARLKIAISIEEARRLEDQIAILSNIGTNKITYVERVHLSDLADKVVSGIQDTYPGDTFKKDYELKLPYVFVDMEHIKKPLVNCLAFYLKMNGKHPIIVQTRNSQPVYVALSFIAQGYQVDQKILDALRIDTGTGISDDGSKEFLIAKKSLELYDGDMSLENIDEGSVLTFKLPKPKRFRKKQKSL